MRGKYLKHSYITQYDNTLTVKSFTVKNQKSVYTLECSVCSKDEELFPLGTITTTGDSIKIGRVPCGCNPKYKKQEFQYNILIHRRCVELGYTYLGYKSKYTGNNTKIILYNPVTDNRWDTTCMSTFLRLGVEDPNEFNKRRGATCKLNDDAHIKDFMNTGKFQEGTTFKRVSNTKWEYNCPVCSNDEYVKAGVCTGVFKGSQCHFKEGKLNCRCSKYKWNIQQREYQIRKTLLGIKGGFTCWELPFKGLRSKFKWTCQKGHNNLTSVYQFFKYPRCKTCCANGFKPYLPAYLYLVLWESEDKTYSCIKYGITNISVISRVKNQKLRTRLSPTILYEFFHEEGYIIEECEKQIGAILGGSYATKDLLPRGFTETIKNTTTNISKVLTIVEGFKLTIIYNK